MKRNSFILIFFAIASLFFFANCKDSGVGNPGASNPVCKWEHKERISFVSVQLNRPSEGLFFFHSIYPMSIPDFTAIFGSHFEQEKSEIKITTTAKQCTGTTSRSQTFTKSNYSSNVWTRGLTSLTAPSNGNTPTVKIEIKSGPHRDLKGGEGYVIWTKTLPANNPYGVHSGQQGVFSGVYKQTKGPSIGKIIYIDGRFQELKF
ncbi:hypothetical protein [Alkalitalea saponilacus]|uniref:Lipoprotein n=1 Tax=Alkalitalea saponilacus TaxID=889453 RepID=A0A1T5AY92_9BACT|nr:hypothetical protein [Alkalitalea saponilacus]ASB48557.1 hypothetical protein CDL62_05095 [Alkalitalea saponilacus]SKB39789.1 hypothetical protein SAMN03080601_00421 [Alkalitalea saponilacus]